MPRSARQDIRVGDGGTIDVLFRFRVNGNPFDATGWTAYAVLGNLHLSALAPPGGSGLGVVEGASAYELYVSATDVSGLSLPVAYSIFLVSPTGDPQPYVQGFVVRDAP